MFGKIETLAVKHPVMCNCQYMMCLRIESVIQAVHLIVSNSCQWAGSENIKSERAAAVRQVIRLKADQLQIPVTDSLAAGSDREVVSSTLQPIDNINEIYIFLKELQPTILHLQSIN